MSVPQNINQNDDRLFEVICLHKDTHPSNLNEVFSSYGCDTLEATVPIVDERICEKLKNCDEEQQVYATLALKSESALNAIGGRAPKTKNKNVRVVEVNGQTFLTTSAGREEAPVNRRDLDLELDDYMSKRNAGSTAQSIENVKPKDEPMSVEALDAELEAHMNEVARVRAQKKSMIETLAREKAMELYED